MNSITERRRGWIMRKQRKFFLWNFKRSFHQWYMDKIYLFLLFITFLINTLNKITHYRWLATLLFIVNICSPVQNYKVYFGLYPSSGMYENKINLTKINLIVLYSIHHHQNPSKSICVTGMDPVYTVLLGNHIYQTMDKVQNKPYSSVRHTPSSESFKVYLFTCPSLNILHHCLTVPSLSTVWP
jgi:hypothetical protein